LYLFMYFVVIVLSVPYTMASVDIRDKDCVEQSLLEVTLRTLMNLYTVTCCCQL